MVGVHYDPSRRANPLLERATTIDGIAKQVCSTILLSTRKSEVKRFEQKSKSLNSWKHDLLLTFRERTYLIVKADRMSRLI